MKIGYAFAVVGVLALLSPAVSARQLKQDSSSITDADILNFALNLEVQSNFWTCGQQSHCVTCPLANYFLPVC